MPKRKGYIVRPVFCDSPLKQLFLNPTENEKLNRNKTWISHRQDAFVTCSGRLIQIHSSQRFEASLKVSYDQSLPITKYWERYRFFFFFKVLETEFSLVFCISSPILDEILWVLKIMQGFFLANFKHMRNFLLHHQAFFLCNTILLKLVRLVK